MSYSRTVRVDGIVFIVTLFVQLALWAASPNSRLVYYLNACRINDWTSECVPTKHAHTALPWCGEPHSRDRVSALMRTMQGHHPAGMRVVPATCFGTNVQIYYMPRRDEFMINPVVIKRDNSETRWYECHGVRRPHHTSITVRYLNSYFNEHTAEFHNVDAMAVECELEP